MRAIYPDLSSLAAGLVEQSLRGDKNLKERWRKAPMIAMQAVLRNKAELGYDLTGKQANKIVVDLTPDESDMITWFETRGRYKC